MTKKANIFNKAYTFTLSKIILELEQREVIHRYQQEKWKQELWKIRGYQMRLYVDISGKPLHSWASALML